MTHAEIQVGMRGALVAAMSLALLAAAGCNGGPSTLGGACQSLASAGCSRAAECGAPTPDNCEGTIVSQCCQSGQCDTQLPDEIKQALSACLSALDSADCTQLAAGQLPAQCSLSTSGGSDECSGDEECASGEICDNTRCTDGCRDDSACGDGEICDELFMDCQSGCRSDDNCADDQYCDTDFDSCSTGCRDDDSCADGEVCSDVGHFCTAA